MPKMMKNKILLFVSLSFIVLSLSSCKKHNNTGESDFTVSFLEKYTDTEIPVDTVYVASDLSIHYRALVKPIKNVEVIHFRIFHDNTKALEYNYTPSQTIGGTAYLIDSIDYQIDYENMAGVIHFVTLELEAVGFDGSKKTTHITYEIQPVNYPFQFRFYDYNASDTLQPGQTVTIRPYFSPMTVNQTISSMKVFEKVGFGAETEIANYGPSDFFYYQVGWLREIDYQVPNLPNGSSIIHRYELTDSYGSKHAIQHSIRVE